MRLYSVLPIGVALVILLIIVLSANPALLAAELAKSDVRFVILTLLVSTASVILRVLKWGILINVGITGLFPVQMLGLSISNFTPGKMAEPVKALVLKLRYGINVSKSLPSIIWERINDILVLIVLSVIAIQTLAPAENLLHIGIISIGLFASMTILFLIILKIEVFGKRFFGALRKLPLLNRISENFVETFYRNKIKKSAIAKSFMVTIFPWLLEGYAFYFSLLAVGLEADPLKMAGIVALAVLIGVLSSLPGGLGSFEAVSIVLLGIAGLTGTKVVAGLVIYRLLSFWYVGFLGLLSFLYLSRRLNLKEIFRQ